MNDYLIDFGFSVIFSILRSVVKDPGKKETMKKVFLKLYTNIGIAYPEFTGDTQLGSLSSIKIK